MIHQEICFCASCDNCGEIFNDGEYSMFPLESDVENQLRNSSDWFAGYEDKDHIGKHYCPDCYELDTDIDDKIILDTSRTKPIEPQSPLPVQGYSKAIELIKYFVDRVEAGTIRSKTTYAKYKEFLASLPTPTKD